ncbi:MFS transporter [Roseibium salinum]|nr:MFS transporter [Roseibium salinum]
MSSAYFFGMVLGCLGAPLVIMRAGHIRAFAALVSLMSAAAILHPVFVDPYAWMLIRVISGFSLAGFYMIVESWLNESASNQNRGTIMSVYIVILFAALMMGQISVATVNISSFVPFAVASLMVSLAVMPVSLTTSTQPAPITLVRFRPAQLYRNSPAAFVGALFVGSSQGALLTLSPLYGSQIGLSTKQAAFYAAAIIGGGLIAQWPVGRLSDMVDRRLVLSGLGAATAAVSLAIVAFFTDRLPAGHPVRSSRRDGLSAALRDCGRPRLRPCAFGGIRRDLVRHAAVLRHRLDRRTADRFGDHEQKPARPVSTS